MPLKEIFGMKALDLRRHFAIPKPSALAITQFEDWEAVDAELNFMRKNNIAVHFHGESSFPQRFRFCRDTPIRLFTKGKIDFNLRRMVGIVGTRFPSHYGMEQCKWTCELLAELEAHLVSGLAKGIDGLAHKRALSMDIQNLGVLGHGLDRIYPAQNRNMAKAMLERGGWVSQFLSQTPPDRENFPQRNKVVAGLVDVLIVVESRPEGGGLLTAKLANSYQRQVFAIPGRNDQPSFSGCNQFIAEGQGVLLHSIDQIRETMGWENRNSAVQEMAIFPDLDAAEEELVQLFQESGSQLHIDELGGLPRASNASLASILLKLEMKSVIRLCPGNFYELFIHQRGKIIDP